MYVLYNSVSCYEDECLIDSSDSVLRSVLTSGDSVSYTLPFLFDLQQQQQCFQGKVMTYEYN